jgi:hypothetical protein
MSVIAASAASPSSPSAVLICLPIRSSASRRHSSAISADCCAPRISPGTSNSSAWLYCSSACSRYCEIAVRSSCGAAPPSSDSSWKNGAPTSRADPVATADSWRL